MKTTSLFLTLTCLLIFGLLPTQAALIPFVIEGEDATWVRVHYSGGTNPNPPYEIVAAQGKDWLHVGRGTSGTRTTGAYYTAGDPGATENNQFADFTGSVVFMGVTSTGVTLRANAGRGIMLRGANTALTNTSRYAILQRGNGLGIYQGVGTAQDGSGAIPLAYTSFEEGTTFQANTQYYLEFSVIGSVIQADLYLWDGELEAVIGESLAYVEYTEATLRDTGYVGLHGFHGGAAYSSYYRDLDISIIPEVEYSVLAAGIALLCMFGLRKRFSQKQE